MNRQLRVQVPHSEAIDEVTYFPDHKRLRVHFLSTDTTWVYKGIPQEVFTELILADTLGGYFNLYIRDKYTVERKRVGTKG